jgi:hypothetical protein
MSNAATGLPHPFHKPFLPVVGQAFLQVELTLFNISARYSAGNFAHFALASPLSLLRAEMEIGKSGKSKSAGSERGRWRGSAGVLWNRAQTMGVSLRLMPGRLN